MQGPRGYSPLHQAHARIQKEMAAGNAGKELTERGIAEKNRARYLHTSAASAGVPESRADRTESPDLAVATRTAGQGESRAQVEWRRLEAARQARELGVDAVRATVPQQAPQNVAKNNAMSPQIQPEASPFRPAVLGLDHVAIPSGPAPGESALYSTWARIQAQHIARTRAAEEAQPANREARIKRTETDPIRERAELSSIRANREREVMEREIQKAAKEKMAGSATGKDPGPEPGF